MNSLGIELLVLIKSKAKTVNIIYRYNIEKKIIQGK